jgi:DNA-binding NtrC family response regulator
MGAMNRAKVWLVDDREENRTRFAERHGAAFEIGTFEDPDQLLTAIRNEHPDALLCDIFFFQDPVEREAKEARVTPKAKQIQILATELHAEQAADGIPLIESLTWRCQSCDFRVLQVPVGGAPMDVGL